MTVLAPHGRRTLEALQTPVRSALEKVDALFTTLQHRACRGGL